MGSGPTTEPEFVSDSGHPVIVRRFLQMIARPDLRSEFPEQYEKHWENKGLTGTVQIIRCKIADFPCELVFSLFFSAHQVVQTGIVLKFEGQTLLNEVQKGDSLAFQDSRRIDPIAFLKSNYAAGAAAPANSKTYTLAVDDDSETELWRAVRHLTGKSEPELRQIWQHLLNTNRSRRGIDQISPIINSWLRRERDRIDLQYLRFAQILHPRPQDVVSFAAPGHTCVVVTKRLRGSHIRELIDAVDPEWWGGRFYRLNQGALECDPRDPKDRLLALHSFESNFEFPIEEIYIDNRHIFSVLFVGDEALVWRTRGQIAPDIPGAMPVIEAPPAARESFLDRFKRKSPSAPAPEAQAPEPPGPPAAHPYRVAQAEKTYMAALSARAPELKDARKTYLQLLFDSDPRRFRDNSDQFRAEVLGTISSALRRDPAAIEKEAALADAHITILYADME